MNPKYVCFECGRHLWGASKCPKCQTCTLVGQYFKTPGTNLAWQGAKELAQMGEMFEAKNLSFMRIRRFVKAMASPAVREYLKLWPVWYRHFEYFVTHPEETP
jgi:hypothetical protein